MYIFLDAHELIPANITCGPCDSSLFDIPFDIARMLIKWRLVVNFLRTLAMKPVVIFYTYGIGNMVLISFAIIRKLINVIVDVYGIVQRYELIRDQFIPF